MKTEIIKKGKLSFVPNLESYEKVYKTFSWEKAKKELSFLEGGKFNAAFNAVDRHLEGWRKNKVALYWEGEDGQEKEYSFLQLALESNKFANVLKKLGIKKSDRVFIFLPRIPELYICFLGILKTGSIAGTLFQAFGPAGILDRLSDSEAIAVITTQEMKKRIYEIKKDLPSLKYIIVVDGKPEKKGEVDFQKEMKEASEDFKIAKMDPDDPAFMLYTSGTTGKPKGVIHRHLAVLQEYMTSRWVLDIKDEDILWCTADPGWVTGISYTILGVWSAGASEVIYDGRFDPSRWYEILEKYKVTVWYTAPTAIRMLMKSGKELVKKYNLSSLRLLASVGEPLNPEAIRWGQKAFGIPFHDNWWQTETGGICIANYPSLDIKLGSMGKPIPGIKATIVNDDGEELPPFKIGNLALVPPWPSLMKEIWKNKEKYQSYFLSAKRPAQKRRSGGKGIKKWYISGDLAYKDKNGYFWFVGRADDVIKTAGERVGPFEVESALIEHPAVVEAGVIGKPDPERGEIIKAFVVLKPGLKGDENLKKEIAQFVKKHLAGHAYPREIEFTDKLPKTRSGKIMRRILKAQELGLPIGDTSTLEEY